MQACDEKKESDGQSKKRLSYNLTNCPKVAILLLDN